MLSLRGSDPDGPHSGSHWQLWPHGQRQELSHCPAPTHQPRRHRRRPLPILLRLTLLPTIDWLSQRQSERLVRSSEVVDQETGESRARSDPPRDTSGGHTEYPEACQQLLDYIYDFGAELNDWASLGASTSRAYNLFLQSGLGLDQFVEQLCQAWAITKERTASIKSGEGGRKHKMGYFFAVLEHQLTGLPRDQEANHA